MDKVICFGSVGKDVFFPTSEGSVIETPEDMMSQKKITFELGAKVKVKDRHESIGGVAANVAIGLKRLGVEALCNSAVGGDEIGIWVKERLREEGMEINIISTNVERMSDFSAIVVDEKTADRVIFTNYTSSGDFHLDKEKVSDAGWFFIGDIHGKWEEQMERIFELAKSENKKVIFNPRGVAIQEDPQEIIEAIGLCEILIVNKDEAIEIVSNMHVDSDPQNINDEKFLLNKLRSLEVKIVVLTDGKRGAWAADGEKVFHVEAQEVPALDSTGAGDSFTSAYLAAHIRGKDAKEGLKWGIANSASVVRHYGATPGLLTEREMLNKTEEVGVEEI